VPTAEEHLRLVLSPLEMAADLFDDGGDDLLEKVARPSTDSRMALRNSSGGAPLTR